MMDPVTILAETVETTRQTQEAVEQQVIPIDLFWQHVTSLSPVEALAFISFGVVCLFYGWRVFRILVVISFGLFGLALGLTIGDKISGSNAQIIGGLLGLVAMSALSVPLMRWAVSILGAVAGGIITSGIWYGCGLNERYILAGALVGIVAGGMISFIIFKIAIMLFSSLGGSALMVVGALALLYLYPQTTERVEELVFTKKWFLPIAMMIPTAAGVIVQNKFVKSSKDWSV